MNVKDKIQNSFLAKKLLQDSIYQNVIKDNKIISKNSILSLSTNQESTCLSPKSLKNKDISYKKLPFSIKKDNKYYEEKKTNTEISLFKSDLFNKDKTLKNNKSLVYKKKYIIKIKKINVYVHKKNVSMNYFININTNIKNNELNSLNENNSNHIRMIIKKDYNNGKNITKNIIVNKKEEISKIIYIQKIWKKLLNKKKKSIINECKKMIEYLPSSLYFSSSNKLNNKNLIDIINKENSENKFNNNIYTNISNYNNNYEILNDYFKTNNYTLIPLSIENNISSKSRNNILKKELLNSLKYYNALYNKDNFNNFFTNDIIDYKIKSPFSSTKLHKRIYSSNEKHKKKVKRYSTHNNNQNIITVKNKLNKWIKHPIEFDYTPHNINKYKLLKPKEKFIVLNSKNNERKLFFNDRKDIIHMPNINSMKKIKINSNNIIPIINLNINVNKKELKKNNLKKVNKKENIIKKYFLDDYENIEPCVNLENKLIMKKPIKKLLNNDNKY